MTTQTNTEEVANVTDIIMRVLSGRKLQVCLNSIAYAVITLTSDVPKEGRDYISSQIKRLSASIDEIEDEESPQMALLAESAPATH